MVDNQGTFILSLILYRTAVLKESTQSCGLVDNRILDKSHNRQQGCATYHGSASDSQDLYQDSAQRGGDYEQARHIEQKHGDATANYSYQGVAH